MIHPTAIVDPKAEIGAGTKIGPYAVVEAGAVLAENCEIGPHVYITGAARIGARNKFHAGCVIGDWPQDVRFRGGPTEVVIGADNVFREHVTVHRSNHPEEPTRIGSHNLLMAHCHAGHNTRIGDHVVIANGALLAGHVTVEDRAFISGNCLAHQFVRVGMLALMQGGSAISKDLPPFTIARGDNGICGLNIIGLRRAGVTNQERLELKALYKLLFRSRKKFAEMLEQARERFHSEKARHMIEFVSTGKRGFCADVSRKETRPDAEESL